MGIKSQRYAIEQYAKELERDTLALVIELETSATCEGDEEMLIVLQEIKKQLVAEESIMQKRFVTVWNHEEDDNKTAVVINDKNVYSLSREYIPSQYSLNRIHDLLRNPDNQPLVHNLEIQDVGLGIVFQLKF